MRLARLFAEEGVDKIRFTGGEPTVRKDLLDIIREVNEIECKAVSLSIFRD